MKNIFTQGLVIIALFFGLLYGLMQIDWMHLFKVKKLTNKTEEKLGEIFWESIKGSDEENSETLILDVLDSLMHKICDKNQLFQKDFQLHVINKDDINAFALPGGHIIVYSGLIKHCDKPEELAGVLCHEIAHIELDHVMKKLVKEFGLSVLISITTGDNSTDMIRETVRLLSSSAFDRSLERDADNKAITYMQKAKMNPEALANFLYKLANEEPEFMEYLAWINTHPNTKERAEDIAKASINKEIVEKEVISETTWELVKEGL